MPNFHDLNELAQGQHGLLTTGQLLASGYSKRMVSQRVQSGVFGRRAKGVVQLAGTPGGWRQDLLVPVLAVPGAVASHRSASRLWQFRSVDTELEVSIRYPRKAQVEGVIVHSSCDLEKADFTEVDGIPVTTPERTICDLGLIFPQHEVQRILRHAIAEELVLTRDLWAMRQRTSKQGRNGTGVLERVLDELPQGTWAAESGLEIQFLEICERFGVAMPTPQLPVRVSGRNFRLDFAWLEQRVFVEIDGAAFHSSPKQIADDGGRQNLLVQAGWTPLRFTFADLTDRPASSARLLKSSLEIYPRKETGEVPNEG